MKGSSQRQVEAYACLNILLKQSSSSRVKAQYECRTLHVLKSNSLLLILWTLHFAVHDVLNKRTEISGRQIVMRKLVASSRTAPNLKSVLKRMRGGGLGRAAFRPSGKEVSSFRFPAPPRRNLSKSTHQPGSAISEPNRAASRFFLSITRGWLAIPRLLTSKLMSWKATRWHEAWHADVCIIYYLGLGCSLTMDEGHKGTVVAIRHEARDRGGRQVERGVLLPVPLHEQHPIVGRHQKMAPVDITPISLTGTMWGHVLMSCIRFQNLKKYVLFST